MKARSNVLAVRSMCFAAGSGRSVYWWCLGCQILHCVNLDCPTPLGEKWLWNGDMVRPSLSPSVLINANHRGYPQPGYDKGFRCHVRVHAGLVHFLSDCHHELRGQTHPLPDLPDWVFGEPGMYDK